MRLQNYLTEALIKIDDKDIDMLYKPLKKYIKQFKNMTFEEIFNNIEKLPTKKGTKIVKEFSSKNLKSSSAIKAHKINPIKIYIGFVPFQSSYVPTEKYIKAGIAETELNNIKDRNIKSFILHEVSHWLDDSLHNLFLTKASKKAEIDDTSLEMGRGEVYLSSFEINAAIHQIADLKKHYKKWDKITFEQMIDLLPNLKATVDWMDLDSADGIKWRKYIIKRMSREKLLGKNMRKK